MNYRTRPVEWRGKIHHVMVEHGEHATHEGLHHTILKHKQIDAAETFDIHLLTPAGSRVHFNYQVAMALATRVQVYRNSTVTGTSEPSRSRNEEIDNVVGPVTITLDGTVVDIGELIADNSYGIVGTTPVNKGQGGLVGADEFMLPENYSWLFRFTSLEADNRVNVRMNFIIEPRLVV